jgi:hypothetical protein
MPQRDYLSFERTPRSEEVQEDPPKQIEKLEHPAFFARFGRSGQADGICGRDSHLERTYGVAARDRYWVILESLMEELGYRDYFGALQRFRPLGRHFRRDVCIPTPVLILQLDRPPAPRPVLVS